MLEKEEVIMIMNWDNVVKLLKNHTQHKHLNLLFDKYSLPKKHSLDSMIDALFNAVENMSIVSVLSEKVFEEWLSLHQIDGNNYTYVYRFEEKPPISLFHNLYNKKNELIERRIWEYDTNYSEQDINKVLTNLDDVTLVDIHRNDINGTYIFSLVSPCIISGKNEDGSNRWYKKLFFAHIVFYDEFDDFKIVFNPTSNLIHVNGVKKKNHDWAPIANLFFEKIEKIIGVHRIKSPKWIPKVLHALAEDATSHNNPMITQFLTDSKEKIAKFATELLNAADIDADSERECAYRNKLIQEIEMSFESQLIEKYWVEEDKMFDLFRQRAEGITHTVNVESREDGFRSCSASHAAKRSRIDGDLDLIGVIYRAETRNYRLFVEYGQDAYLIKGTSAFIEEEVVNIVIRKLNEYREQIQSTENSSVEYSEGASLSSSL